MDVGHGQNQRQHQQRKGPGWGFKFFGGGRKMGPELNLAEIYEEESADGLSFPLASAQIGDRLWIVGLRSKGDKGRLLGMGLHPGAEIEVISTTPGGSVIVAIQNNRIGVDGGMAKKIAVSSDRAAIQNQKQMKTNTSKTLKDLEVGAKGKVTQYEKTDDKQKKTYRRKLLAMGLTPGTEFSVSRIAPLGDPVEILVRGFKLSLRKDEAETLGVEEIE